MTKLSESVVAEAADAVAEADVLAACLNDLVAERTATGCVFVCRVLTPSSGEIIMRSESDRR